MKNLLLLFFIIGLIGCGSNSSTESEKLSVELKEIQDAVFGKQTILNAKTTGKITKYEWREDGTLLGNDVNLTKSDFSQGEHNITLTVIDSEGNSATDSSTILVYTMVLSSYIENNPESNARHIYEYNTKGEAIKHSIDADRDGVIDSRYTIVHESNKVTNLLDSNMDGETDSIEIITYDNLGNILRHTKDNNASGEANYIVENIYDESGNMLSQTKDNDGDGIIDYQIIYTYDEQGNKLSYLHREKNRISSIEFYIYDDRGNLLQKNYDFRIDGTFNRVTKNSYDEQNNRLSQTVDKDGDGVVDEIKNYTYDSNGKRLSYRNDYDADGVVDWIEESTFDENGNRLTNGHGHGAIDMLFIYTYTEDGKIATYIKDNGISKNKTTYSYNKRGDILEINQDYNGDGEPDLLETYTYDKQGNKLSYRFAFPSNPNNNGELHVWTYDERSNMLTSSYDGDVTGDGKFDSIKIYTYDKHNNKLSEGLDSDGDGVTDSQKHIYVNSYDNYGVLVKVIMDDVVQFEKVFIVPPQWK